MDNELLQAILSAIIQIDQRIHVLDLDTANVIYNKAIEMNEEDDDGQ